MLNPRSSVEIHLYKPAVFVPRSVIMLKKIMPLLPVLLLAGCTTATFSRLTPNQQPRNANNLYPVEVAFDSNRQALRWDSIKPYVIVGDQAYLMRPMPYLSNRWETLVPVPAGQKSLHYQYKLDWQYNAIPEPRNDSVISPQQTLTIMDR